MGTVTEYLQTVADPHRSLLQRIVEIARELAPDVEEGTSYGMPALLVDGKGFVSVLETKKHLALYPFSGQILPEMSEELGGYSWSPGTLRFSEDNPCPIPWFGGSWKPGWPRSGSSASVLRRHVLGDHLGGGNHGFPD